MMEPVDIVKNTNEVPEQGLLLFIYLLLQGI